MTFWSDDRNHLLDDLMSGIWFGLVALAIGVPPLQFPMLVLTVRVLEQAGGVAREATPSPLTQPV